jgi:hypothetical protein
MHAGDYADIGRGSDRSQEIISCRGGIAVVKYFLIGSVLIGFGLLHGIAVSMMETRSTADVSVVLSGD